MTPEQTAACKAAGIDPAKLKNLPWAQILAIIESIIALFQGTPSPTPVQGKQAAVGCCCLKDHLEHLQRIATLQQALACCSQDCLKKCQDCC